MPPYRRVRATVQIAEIFYQGNLTGSERQVNILENIEHNFIILFIFQLFALISTPLFLGCYFVFKECVSFIPGVYFFLNGAHLLNTSNPVT